MAIFNGRAENIENNLNKVDQITEEFTRERYPSIECLIGVRSEILDHSTNNKSDIMRYIRDNCANALGEYREEFVIGLHDVSPLTDYLTALLVSVDDPVTSKKLYVAGKNLWNHDATQSFEGAKSFDVDLRPATYTLSAIVNTTYTGSSSVRIHDQTNNALLGFLSIGGESSLTFTLSSPCKRITLYAAPDDVASAGQTATYYMLQMEASASASPYQPYIEPIEYTPDENGIVSGIVPILEGMTMYSDDNVIVAVNYNRDLKKVLENITNAIISLGGTI